MNKQIRYTLFFFLFIFSVGSVYSQTQEQKLKDFESWKAALEFEKPIEKALKANDLLKAEQLFLQSLAIYPTFLANLIPPAKMKIGDVKGANLLWEKIISSFKKNEQLLVRNRTGSSPKVSDYIYLSGKDEVRNLYFIRASANVVNGDIRQALKDFLTVESTSGLDPEGYRFLALYATQVGDFETARRSIDSLKKIYQKGRKLFDMQLVPVYSEALLFMAMGEYDKAIPLAERLETEDKGLNTFWKGYSRLMKAEIYAGLGEVEKAQKALGHALKQISVWKNRVNVQYTTGLVALSGKEYVKAIDAFTKESNNKEAWGKYRIYTKRAEAYIGLKEYTKARQDYEAALLYNPEFEPAIIGLAKLQSNVVQLRKTDKTPPQITITEPTGTRGLIVKVAGNDIMIKGVAADPAGLKSVTINGEKVYSQESGIFWGNVPLQEGMNKVTVSATDLSGNTGNEVFDIERAATAVPIAIIPVKEGRNFAVLIGCQNYDDSNIPSLEDPISDAIKLKMVLKNNYNYDDGNIITLFNPERSDFKKQFLQLNEKILPEDNLIIFYAGHGIWREKEQKGFWLLTEAKRDDVNTWLSNKEVLDMIGRLPARHTLLITDACFSGSVFKTRGLGDMPVVMQQMNEKITRVAITSGNDTEVPDKSVFMKYLIKALSENKEKYLTAQKMFIIQIIEAVMTETKTEPRYGTLELAGHVGGDYIFMKK